MSSSTDGWSYMVFGPFGGKGEEYQRFHKINGIKALYTTNFIKSITFEVDPSTSTTVQPGRNDGKTPYKVRLEDGEGITKFCGYFEKVNGQNGREVTVIRSLEFKTNKGNILGPTTAKSGEPFSVLPAAGKISEIFVGKTSEFLASIGARVVLPTSQYVMLKSVKSIGPFGGARPWDDGISTRVKKIHIYSTTDHFIRSIKFVYDFGGEKDVAFLHPEIVSRRNDEKVKKIELIEKEYFTSIAGHTRDDGSIQALEFYTNKDTYPWGDPKKGKYFGYPSTGTNEIVGFHGTWGETLNSIGVYLKPISPTAPRAQRGTFLDGSGGKKWDDGKHSHVIGYRVTDNEDHIESITFMYDDNGSSVERPRHGGGREDTGVWIMLNFPEERLKYLTGYWRMENNRTIIHNLQLHTTSWEPKMYAEKIPWKDVEDFENWKKLSAESKEPGGLKKPKKERFKNLDKEIKRKKLEQKFEGSTLFEIPEKRRGRISGFFGREDGYCLNSIGAHVGSY